MPVPTQEQIAAAMAAQQGQNHNRGLSSGVSAIQNALNEQMQNAMNMQAGQYQNASQAPIHDTFTIDGEPAIDSLPEHTSHDAEPVTATADHSTLARLNAVRTAAAIDPPILESKRIHNGEFVFTPGTVGSGRPTSLDEPPPLIESLDGLTLAPVDGESAAGAAQRADAGTAPSGGRSDAFHWVTPTYHD